MTKYFNDMGWPDIVNSNAEKDALVKELHKIKTEKFQMAVESGLCPIRPGGNHYINLCATHAFVHTC